MIMLSKLLALFMFFMNLPKYCCTKTQSFGSIVKNTIVLNDKMPSIYMERNHIRDNIKKNKYSIEHIFPRSYLLKKDIYDMHNTVKTINELNVQRSNYKYINCISDDSSWKELIFDNHVNHKKKLFVPNIKSRGFISRSLLYMMMEYGYNPFCVIDKETLVNWFYTYPPDSGERYHNEVVKNIQNKNNIFISNYNKKAKTLNRFIEQL